MSTRRRPQHQRRRPVSTGIKVEARSKHHARLEPPPPGQHMWIMVAMFRVGDPEADPIHLDMENLATMEGPGCFLCEQHYSAETAATRCTGDRAC